MTANWAFCRRFDVLNVPALVCFVDGTWHETAIGQLREPQLEARLQAWLNT
jgi:hypothetical protein